MVAGAGEFSCEISEAESGDVQMCGSRIKNKTAVGQVLVGHGGGG
jgi:hypothetical protein